MNDRGLQSGLGSKKEACEGGREAMEQAIASLTGPPEMVWVFGAISYDQPKLLRGVRPIAREAPLIGCTTDGEISTGLSTDSVTVLALRCDHLKFKTVVVGSLSGGSFAAGVKVGKALRGTCRYLQLFSDGIKGQGLLFLQ